MKKLFLLFIILIIHDAALAQVRKRLKHRRNYIEEFYGIDHIKHGLYIKKKSYPLFTDYILAFGNYDKNLRMGEWQTFYLDPYNSLKSIGSYVKSKKEGPWKYYYPFKDSTLTVSTALGLQRKAGLIENKEWHGLKGLVYDTAGQPIMAKGDYVNDYKFGIWNYYSDSGKLIHRYDHTTGKLLVNNATDTLKTPLVFLGGEDRFNMLFFYGLYEDKSYFSLNRNSEATFEIEISDDMRSTYKLISSSGGGKLKIATEKVLQTLPDDWIFLDPMKKELKLTVKAKKVEKEGKQGMVTDLIFSDTVEHEPEIQSLKNSTFKN